MFTGLVERTGTIETLDWSESKKSLRLGLRAGSDFDWSEGESIAVNGCCLTAVGRSDHPGLIFFDVSSETLSKTSIGGLKKSDEVNLERALRMGDRLGGHLVSGHVDGLGEILSFQKSPNGSLLVIEVPSSLGRYCIPKGSVCLDGISLTINELKDIQARTRLDFMIIPTTLERTNLKHRVAGAKLNFEVDQFAKFAERLRQSSDHV